MPTTGLFWSEGPKARKLIIASLDPLTGRGPELTRLPLDPTHDDSHAVFGVQPGASLALSPDGSRIAFTLTPSSPIQIFTVQGQPIQKIRVKGWSNLLECHWAQDGKGLYVVSGTRGDHVVLYVDLQGNAHRLWEGVGSSWETWVRPSPDGRHLGISTWTTAGNMWRMEDF